MERFWAKWENPYKAIYMALLLLIVLSVVVINWSSKEAFPLQTLSKTTSVQIHSQTVKDPVFYLPIPLDRYLILQSQQGGDLQLSPWALYGFLGFTLLFLSLWLTIATYLNRFWFVAMLSGFLLWALSLRLDDMLWFGMHASFWAPLALIGLGFGLATLLKDYTEWPFLARAGSFLALFGVFLIVLKWGSSLAYPLQFIALTSTLLPLIILIFFTLLVGAELIQFIFFMLTKQREEANNWNVLHFIILSTLYFGYVFLTYMHVRGLITWDIVYLKPEALLIISAVFGVWGFRKREPLYENILPFKPLGGLLFLLLAGMSICFIQFNTVLANDPQLEAIDDFILYAHLGVGAFFFFYLLGNFFQPMVQGLPVGRVMFKPNRIPYYVVSLGGIVVFGALAYVADLTPFYQSLSGFYNNLGDYYQQEKEPAVSKTFYQLSTQYGFDNHKANYSLGRISERNKKWADAVFYYKHAVAKNPTPQAYLNLSRAFDEEPRLFDAIFTLQKGVKKFPESVGMKDALGVLFERSKWVDSAHYYWVKAAMQEPDQPIAYTNLLSLYAKQNSILPMDSIQGKTPMDYLPAVTNFMAFADQQEKPVRLPKDFILDSALSYNEFSYLFNAGMHAAKQHDSSRWSMTLRYREANHNSPFEEPLNYAAAVQAYYSGEVSDAFSRMYDLCGSQTLKVGYYHLLWGLWAYEQQDWSLAQEQFDEAEKAKYPGATTYKIITLIQQERLYEANQLLQKELEKQSVDSARMRQDPLYHFLQADMKKLTPSFAYLMLQKNTAVTPEENAVLMNKIKGTHFEDWWHFSRLKQQLAQGDSSMLAKKLASLLTSNDELLHERVSALQLEVWLKQKNWKAMDTLSAENFSRSPRNYELLIHAVQARRDTTQGKRLFEKLGSSNPFFATGVLTSAQYFDQQTGDYQKGYQILIRALRANPGSVALRKAYVLQCIHLKLFDYADQSMQDLEQQLSATDWEKFSGKVEQLKQEIQKDMEVW